VLRVRSDDSSRHRERRGHHSGRGLWPWILTLVLLVASIGSALALASRGGDEPGLGRDTVNGPPVGNPEEGSQPAAVRAALPIRRLRVGRGANAAVIAYRGRLETERPAVVFLHGWGVTISRYDGWIDHLVRLGDTVIAPRYQTSPQADPAGVRAAAVAGVRRALDRVQVTPGTLVMAGHSAGGALAADLAVVASSGSALPRPAAIFAVFPGRAILGYPGGIPAQPLSKLPRATRLTALAGADDRIVGQAPARAMADAATTLPSSRRRFILVKDPRVDDHYAPTRDGRAAQRAFWHRLDRLSLRARATARR